MVQPRGLYVADVYDTKASGLPTRYRVLARSAEEVKRVAAEYHERETKAPVTLVDVPDMSEITLEDATPQISAKLIASRRRLLGKDWSALTLSLDARRRPAEVRVRQHARRAK